MIRAEEMRRILLALLILTCGVALGFILVIVGNIENGIEIHEIAGLVLLILLMGGFWAAVKLRRVDATLIIHVSVALVFLVVAGVLGAALAAGSATGAPVGLPLIPLTLLLVVVMDAIRVTWNLQKPAPPSAT
ncbi:MAG: hypothetical protein WAN87_07395 [Thermoplasmata archaeon]